MGIKKQKTAGLGRLLGEKQKPGGKKEREWVCGRVLAAVAVVFLMLPLVSAYCTSDSDCTGLNCQAGSKPLCNKNNGTCYCGPTTCGNLVCESNENYLNCPADCIPSCGNGSCDTMEDNKNCPADCEASCGNSVCESGETQANCPEDCTPSTYCCEWEIDSYTGAQRCILYCAVCGDGYCDSARGEDSLTCSKDCGPLGCGDGVCSPQLGEDSINCPEDCEAEGCKNDNECKGTLGCDFIRGEDYSSQCGTFNVCGCVDGSCKATFEAKGACGDSYCDPCLESCDPTADKFCEADCGRCDLPDLKTSISTSTPYVNSGETIKLSVKIENTGSAAAGAFRFELRRGSTDGELIAGEDFSGLFLTCSEGEFKGAGQPKGAGRSTREILLAGQKQAFNAALRPVAGGTPPEILLAGNSPPTAILRAEPKYGAPPLNVAFDASDSYDSDGMIVKYEMDWEGDGKYDFSSAPPSSNFSYSYGSAGFYYPTLRVTDNGGATSTDKKSIIVCTPPITRDYEQDTNFLCGDVNFFAIADSDNSVEESSESNNIASLTVHVSCEIPPVAVIDANPTFGSVPLDVNFDGSRSYDPRGRAIVSWDWNFGDGATGAGRTVMHTYLTNGSFTAVLVVTNSAGGKGRDTKTIVVGRKPVADFNAEPTSGSAPLTVNFDASASYDPDGEIVSYDWFFGDGSKGSGKTTAHTYNSQGDYNALLKVTDNDGLTGSAQVIIHVFSSAYPDLIVESIRLEKGEVPINETVNLTATIKNIGGSDANDFYVAVRKGSVDSPDLDEEHVESLPALQSVDINLSFNSGFDLGTFTYYVIADSRGSVRESNKRNNIMSFELKVGVEEICGNGFDDDGDGYVDEGCYEVCGNEKDDDGDGLVDEGCYEVCGNEKDDNNNGFIDEGCVEICDNNKDDDGDGFIDEEDCEWELKDSDGDGLHDRLERDIGTDPYNPDTDGDMLWDGEEYFIYKTDPTNPDTDGDNISDGEEVLHDHTNPLDPQDNLLRPAFFIAVNVGDAQEIVLEHPRLGAIKNIRSDITFPSGAKKTLEAEQEKISFAIREAGEYTFSVYKNNYKYASRFRAVTLASIVGETLSGAAFVIFGSESLETYWLLVVLVAMSLLASALAYYYSRWFFGRGVKATRVELTERLARLFISSLFFVFPALVNRFLGISPGIIAVVLEIIIILLLAYAARAKELAGKERPIRVR